MLTHIEVRLIYCVGVDGSDGSDGLCECVRYIFLEMCSLNCYGSSECCRVSSNGVEYCQVESQCMRDPEWEVIVIPAVIFLFLLIVAAIIIYKCCTGRKHTMQVTNFAQQEMYL